MNEQDLLIALHLADEEVEELKIKLAFAESNLEIEREDNEKLKKQLEKSKFDYSIFQEQYRQLLLNDFKKLYHEHYK